MTEQGILQRIRQSTRLTSVILLTLGGMAIVALAAVTVTTADPLRSGTLGSVPASLSSSGTTIPPTACASDPNLSWKLSRNVGYAGWAGPVPSYIVAKIADPANKFVSSPSDNPISDVAAGDLNTILATNPNFIYYKYNSLSDNYAYTDANGPVHDPTYARQWSEDSWLYYNSYDVADHSSVPANDNKTLSCDNPASPSAATCGTYENIYLHFKDNTQYCDSADPATNYTTCRAGHEFTILGYDTLPADQKWKSRVPVYNYDPNGVGDGTRSMVNYADPRTRRLVQAYEVSPLELHKKVVAQPSSLPVGLQYPGGVYYDNAYDYTLNWGWFMSGGHVVEDSGNRSLAAPGTPYNATADRAAIVKWYYDLEKTYLREERQSFITPDAITGRSFKISTNITNVPMVINTGLNSQTDEWRWAYVNGLPADEPSEEYNYAPYRTGGTSTIGTLFDQHQGGIDSGMKYDNTGAAGIPDVVPPFTAEQAITAALGMHWVLRYDNLDANGNGGDFTTAGVYAASPNSNVPYGVMAFSPIFDVDLGKPVEPAVGVGLKPYILSQGSVTGAGGQYPYTVYARRFSCGLALVRLKSFYENSSGLEGNLVDPVTVNLGGWFQEVDINGNAVGGPTQTADINTSDGKIFVAVNSDGTMAAPITPQMRSGSGICTPNWSWQDTSFNTTYDATTNPGGWSTCVAGVQNRVVVDLNACGVQTSRPALTQSCSVSDATAPSVPTSLAPGTVTSSSIALTWGVATDTGGSGLAGYHVFRCQGASCTPVTQVSSPVQANFTDNGLSASTAYTYSVSAYDNAGNESSHSTVLHATTSAPPAGAPVIASATASPNSGTAPLSVDFSAVVSGGYGTLSYTWTVLSGSTTVNTVATSTAVSSYTFTNAGTYTVQLNVTDQTPATVSAGMTVTVSAPSPAPCTPNWQPTGWTACSPDGKQNTIDWTDANNCSSPGAKPAAGSRSCTPPVCVSQWSCSDWSACQDSTQARTCTDQHACPTPTDQPTLTRSCSGTGGAAPAKTPNHLIAGSGSGDQPLVRIFSPTGQLEKQFSPYLSTMTKGIHVASGDVFGTGTDSIITAPAKGATPEIRIFSSTGKLLKSFLAYPKSFKGGVNLTVGDINGDGTDEIITAPETNGASPVIRIFTAKGKLIREFYGFEKSFRGGISLAVGDVLGFGTDQIIIAPATVSKTRVRIIDAHTSRPTLRKEFTAYPTKIKAGLSLAVGDAEGNGTLDIITAPAAGNQSPQIRLYSSSGKLLKSFLASSSAFKGGVMLAAGDLLKSDQITEILTTTYSQGFPRLFLFQHQPSSSYTKTQDITAFPGRKIKSASVAVGGW